MFVIIQVYLILNIHVALQKWPFTTAFGNYTQAFFYGAYGRRETIIFLNPQSSPLLSSGSSFNIRSRRLSTHLYGQRRISLAMDLNKTSSIIGISLSKAYLFGINAPPHRQLRWTNGSPPIPYLSHSISMAPQKAIPI